MTFTPSPGQQVALDSIKHWYEDPWSPQVYRMFGPAGTGKTTIARLVPEMLGLESWNYAAFSGKAAQVLRSKGCVPANTLHSLVYGAPINLAQEEKKLVRMHEDFTTALHHDGTGDLSPGARALLGRLSGEEMKARIGEIEEELISLRSQIRRNGPFLWPQREDGPLRTTNLLMADEVSMVNDRMAEDILDNGCKVLVLGDPEQLPPIGGDGYFTRQAADVMLTEVHRQALESPVLALATRVRLGGRVALSEYSSGRGLDYTSYDQILCWTRRTRWGAIGYVRSQLDRPVGEPVPGDRVMNLANNKDLGVFNGQTFVVDEVQDGRDDGERYFTLHEESEPDKPIYMNGFVYGFTQEGEKQAEKQRLGWRGDTALLTFSQALTVHKAQGSEWPNVLVVDETRSMWSMEAQRSGSQHADTQVRRWLYTAITRAADSVTLVRK
jgi:exodeoxyribonuclease-5